MRIVNRADFLALPAGTLFSDYSPGGFECISIKGESGSSGDFVRQELTEVRAEDSGERIDILLAAEEPDGPIFELDLYCCGRDGMFDPDAKFVVWSLEEHGQLVDRLLRAIIQRGKV
jgi:hypothetical protein